ncbi:MAG: AMP-binding protein [Chitinophagales bacterium]
MKDFTRLFDILKYQEQKYPRFDCLNYKYNGNWRNYSTAEVNEIIDKVSKAFIKVGIQKNDKVAIVSNNRPEWNFIDNGMLQIGAVNVPVYPTISMAEYEYIFNNAEIKMVFISDASLYKKIAAIKDKVPSLTKIYSFEKVESCEHWESFLKEGEDVDIVEVRNRANEVKHDELATIIYTSGTTGNPKGVMLSHDNIISNIKSV